MVRWRHECSDVEARERLDGDRSSSRSLADLILMTIGSKLTLVFCVVRHLLIVSRSANGKVREPEMLKRWEDEALYQKCQTKNQGRREFILHDGPPCTVRHLAPQRRGSATLLSTLALCTGHRCQWTHSRGPRAKQSAQGCHHQGKADERHVLSLHSRMGLPRYGFNPWQMIPKHGHSDRLTDQTMKASP